MQILKSPQCRGQPIKIITLRTSQENVSLNSTPKLIKKKIIKCFTELSLTKKIHILLCVMKDSKKDIFNIDDIFYFIKFIAYNCHASVHLTVIWSPKGRPEKIHIEFHFGVLHPSHCPPPPPSCFAVPRGLVTGSPRQGSVSVQVKVTTY